MACFASQRNLGQNEDTSCYLIFLQELNGGGERSSLLPSPPLPPPFRKIRSSRCHSLKATRHYCPFFHVFCLSSWALKRKPGNGQWGSSCHQWFPCRPWKFILWWPVSPAFLPSYGHYCRRTYSKKPDSLEWNKGGYFWSGEKGMLWYEPSQPSIPISS